jgi:hypothetical protein
LAVITSGIWLSKGRALSAPSADLLAYLTIAIYVFVLGTIPSRCYWLARVAREHLRRLPGGQYVQANPSQSKQKCLVLLGFAWFYSSEPGLFNGLPRKKQKNPLLPLFAERRRARRERESGAPERI